MSNLENYKGHRRYRPFFYFNRDEQELQVGRLVIWIYYIGMLVGCGKLCEISQSAAWRRGSIGWLNIDMMRKYVTWNVYGMK
jgi:hypothetical protein